MADHINPSMVTVDADSALRIAQDMDAFIRALTARIARNRRPSADDQRARAEVAVSRWKRQDEGKRNLSRREDLDDVPDDGFDLDSSWTEVAALWPSIVRDLRAHIGRQTYAERRAAEREWVKPRPTDYMGELTFSEYMGAAA